MRIDDLFDVGAKDGPEVVSDRVLTVPNLLSFLRLLVMPLVYVDVVDGRYVRALVVLGVLASTDWIDGYVARRFDQTSRLGKLLDPVSDRVLVVLVVVALGVAGIVPWWALAVVLVRDLLVALATVMLALRRAVPPPVSRVGKTATFVLMTVFPTFLLAEALGGEAREVLRLLCAVAYAVGAALYWAAAAGYARTLLRPRTVAPD